MVSRKRTIASPPELTSAPEQSSSLTAPIDGEKIPTCTAEPPPFPRRSIAARFSSGLDSLGFGSRLGRRVGRHDCHFNRHHQIARRGVNDDRSSHVSGLVTRLRFYGECGIFSRRDHRVGRCGDGAFTRRCYRKNGNRFVSLVGQFYFRLEHSLLHHLAKVHYGRFSRQIR